MVSYNSARCMTRRLDTEAGCWKATTRPLWGMFGSGRCVVNIRLTHPKKSAVEHRVIIELGVIRQEAPATLAAGSDPGGQANATRTPLATAEFRHGPLV